MPVLLPEICRGINPHFKNCMEFVMKTKFAVLRSKGVKVVSIVAAAATASVPAFADTAAAIAAAETEGTGNVTLAVGAVIAAAAIMFCIGYVRSLIGK